MGPYLIKRLKEDPWHRQEIGGRILREVEPPVAVVELDDIQDHIEPILGDMYEGSGINWPFADLREGIHNLSWRDFHVGPLKDGTEFHVDSVTWLQLREQIPQEIHNRWGRIPTADVHIVFNAHKRENWK